MIERKKYYAGKNNYQWEVKLAIYKKHNLYKFVLTDDEDTDIYIVTNYVTPTTANALEEVIDKIMCKSAQYESLVDVYNALQNTFYGRFFSWRNY